jgi:hypothetical protein
VKFLLSVLFVCSIVLAASAQERTEYPMLELKNEQLRVVLYLPDTEMGFYRGVRFDWSGVIERVEYAGHRFYGLWRTPHDPTGNDYISGPAEEFGMDNPMGFAEAKEGESFVKIGVGLLRKNDREKYYFLGKYELIRAGAWEIEHGDTWVDFSQDFVGERGWAYRYHKRVELTSDRPGLNIVHRLENTGKKKIDINHYNHNFTLIDEVLYGPDYSVEFPFPKTEPEAIRDVGIFHGNRIEATRRLGGKSLSKLVHPGPGPVAYNAGKVRNNKTGAEVHFKGDAPIIKYNFWSVETAACPEPFIGIVLEPGQVQEWTNEYTFAADNKE